MVVSAQVRATTRIVVIHEKFDCGLHLLSASISYAEKCKLSCRRSVAVGGKSQQFAQTVRLRPLGSLRRCDKCKITVVARGSYSTLFHCS